MSLSLADLKSDKALETRFRAHLKARGLAHLYHFAMSPPTDAVGVFNGMVRLPFAIPQKYAHAAARAGGPCSSDHYARLLRRMHGDMKAMLLRELAALACGAGSIPARGAATR